MPDQNDELNNQLDILGDPANSEVSDLDEELEDEEDFNDEEEDDDDLDDIDDEELDSALDKDEDLKENEY